MPSEEHPVRGSQFWDGMAVGFPLGVGLSATFAFLSVYVSSGIADAIPMIGPIAVGYAAAFAGYTTGPEVEA